MADTWDIDDGIISGWANSWTVSSEVTPVPFKISTVNNAQVALTDATLAGPVSVTTIVNAAVNERWRVEPSPVTESIATTTTAQISLDNVTFAAPVTESLAVVNNAQIIAFQVFLATRITPALMVTNSADIVRDGRVLAERLGPLTVTRRADITRVPIEVAHTVTVGPITVNNAVINTKHIVNTAEIPVTVVRTATKINLRDVTLGVPAGPVTTPTAQINFADHTYPVPVRLETSGKGELVDDPDMYDDTKWDTAAANVTVAGGLMTIGKGFTVVLGDAPPDMVATIGQEYDVQIVMVQNPTVGTWAVLWGGQILLQSTQNNPHTGGTYNFKVTATTTAGIQIVQLVGTNLDLIISRFSIQESGGGRTATINENWAVGTTPVVLEGPRDAQADAQYHVLATKAGVLSTRAADPIYYVFAGDTTNAGRAGTTLVPNQAYILWGDLPDTDESRIIRIPIEDRTIYVKMEDRVVRITEDRVVHMGAEDRTIRIPNEDRIINMNGDE